MDMNASVIGMFLNTKRVCLWTPENTIVECGAHGGSNKKSVKYNTMIMVSSDYATFLEFPKTSTSSLKNYMKTVVQRRLDQLELGTLKQLKKVTGSVVWESLGTPSLPKGMEALKEPFWLSCHQSRGNLRDVLFSL
jgi:hypothetical protein